MTDKQIRLAPGEFEHVKYVVMSQEKLEELGYSPCRVAFTITTGRSGTDWLCHLLNRFGEVRATHEPYPAMFEVNRHRAEGRITKGEAIYACRQMRSQLVRHSYHHGQVYVDVTPMTAHLVNDFKAAFEGARFIHLARNPRDFVLSALPRLWYEYPTSQSHWWPKNHPKNYNQAQRLMWWWNEVHTRGLAAEKRYGDDCYRLRAEDMWTQIEPVRNLLRWLQVPEIVAERCDGIVAEAQERPRNKSQQQKSEWSPMWEDFLQDTCGKTMRRLGYE
jgi:hypothetical protein